VSRTNSTCSLQSLVEPSITNPSPWCSDSPTERSVGSAVGEVVCSSGNQEEAIDVTLVCVDVEKVENADAEVDDDEDWLSFWPCPNFNALLPSLLDEPGPAGGKGNGAAAGDEEGTPTGPPAKLSNPAAMRRLTPWTPPSSTGAPREAKGGNKEVVRTADL